MIELAIVLVIIGLVVTLVGTSFYTLLQGQRLAKTRAALDQAKECFFQRAYYSERYPTFTSPLPDCGAIDPTLDVDDCLCTSGIRDAWGEPFRFIEARDDTSTPDPLAGQPAVDDPLREQSRAAPSPNTNATTPAGEAVTDLAFALISFGRDRTADHASYSGLLTNTLTATMTADSTLILNAGTDDIAIVVTSRELARHMRQ